MVQDATYQDQHVAHNTDIQRFRLRRWRTGLMAATLLVMQAACQPNPESFDRPQTQAQPYASPSGYGLSSSLPQGQMPADAGAWGSAPSHVVKVGLLVPLSGQAAQVGKALQDAAVMALFDKYASLSGPQAGVRVELVPKDTLGTPSGARQAAADAIKEGAQLMIGPLFSQSVEAIKPLAKSGQYSIISFSNNKAVAGQGVYVMGFDPAEQTQRAVQYALLNKGVNQLGAFVPNDAYGRSVTDAAKQVATLLGRKLDPVSRYAAASPMVQEDVKSFVRAGAQGSGRAYDGLLLAEGSDKLGAMLAAFKDAGVSAQTVQLVGTGQWDDRDLIRRYPLEGAILASSPPQLYEAFEDRFKSSYGYKPPRVASLAYDAVALATTIATTTGSFNRDAITSPAGFMGPANGLFRFKPDGTVERGLAVLQVQGDRLKVLDAAKQSF